MAGSRLALVANDPTLTRSIQAHLEETTGQTPFTGSFASIRERLGQDTDGLLLLAADRAEDSEEVLRLVQEISLKQWPPTVLVLEGEAALVARDLSLLDPYVARRLRWPEEAADLEMLVKEHVGRGRNFTGIEEESLVEVIGRHLLCHTPSLQMLVEPIALAASYDVPVLLSGETGTGKTYLARLIHACSPRKHHRFLVVSCGALAANLIESEFFGHTKGAFTGADRAKEGKFAAAGNGTLLLDEIDTLSLEQQANLLRVLETGEYEPVGSNQTQVCTARIIAASNWNLEEAVEQGKFRRDLYYRLHVMAFHLPPLRERVADIAPLVRGMAAHFNHKFRKSLFDLHPDALAALEAFPWPGNLRQLENVIQQAVLVSTGPELLRSHLPPSLQKGPVPALGPGQALGASLVQHREEAERLSIRRALENAGDNRTSAAQALGISRVTLYKKMKKYGLMPKNNLVEQP
jgi:two-component system, NtrC family, response regulator HydG